MQNKSRAFTLIELLVVVLIIGILAAVALPQYQLAVAKSRYINLMLLAKEIAKAESIYFLAEGKYTDNLTELDLDFPTSDTQGNSYFGRQFCMKPSLTWNEVTCVDPRIPALYTQVFSSATGSGTCTVYGSHPTTQQENFVAKLCKSLGGRVNGASYLIQ